jgi:hypothetical protein
MYIKSYPIMKRLAYNPASEDQASVTPGRGHFTVERAKYETRISKSETNIKFECSKVQNKQESAHLLTAGFF